MNLLKGVERLILKTSRYLGLVGLMGLLAIAFATVLDVFLRWLFASPITGVRDAGSLFVAVVIATSFSATIAQRSNITIRFLGSSLPGRWREYLDVFGNIVTVVFFAVMARQLWFYANELALNHDTTIVLGWPVAPWWRIASVLIAFCVPIQIVVICQICKSIHAQSGAKKTPAGEKMGFV